MLDLRDDRRPELLRAFRESSDPKAVKRAMVALAYLDGESVATISGRYGIPEPTCYDWLNRVAEGPVEEAVSDDPSSGRPAKLDGDQRNRLARVLRSSPDRFGYDADEWTGPLVREYVAAEFDVNYSEGHARRLLSELQ